MLLNSYGGLAVKKYKAPYLQSKIGELGLLSEAKQRAALEFLANFELFNDEVDETQYYYRMTFDSSLSTENHSRVSNMTTAHYVNIGERARNVLDRIDAYSAKGS